LEGSRTFSYLIAREQEQPAFSVGLTHGLHEEPLRLWAGDAVAPGAKQCYFQHTKSTKILRMEETPET